jgi:hypothetical protein
MTSPHNDEPRRPGDAARRSGAALEAMFRFIVWLIPTLDKLPRNQKFLLGDRIQATALDVLAQAAMGHGQSISQPQAACCGRREKCPVFEAALPRSVRPRVILSPAVRGSDNGIIGAGGRDRRHQSWLEGSWQTFSSVTGATTQPPGPAG